MSKLLLIRGLPGSGKSTLARLFKDYINLEADMYFEQSGKWVFDKDRLSEAHTWCLKETKIQLEKGNFVVVSNTFTRNKEMVPYFELGYPTEVIETKGNWKNIHGVPDDHIELMRNNWEELVIPTKSEEERGFKEAK